MSDLSSINQMNLGGGLSQASSYTDFKALAELRAKVTDDSPEKSKAATKEVAKQFESLFLQMMLKSMRDATYVDKKDESDQTRFYQDMFDKQIALDLSNRENGGIGLAKIMEQQMSGGVKGGYQNNHTEKKSIENTFSNTRHNFYNTSLDQQFEKVNLQLKTHENNLDKAFLISDKNNKENWKVDSPSAFTQALWQHAKVAAEKIGVKPEVLIAQAALETGWGDKMIKDVKGNNANNLFGIKADARWQGERITVPTLEFRDGVAVKELASFRSYNSLAKSFEDYANFLQSNPRYQNALAHTSNSDLFLEKLQQAGYSTDPAYAEKIKSITSRDSFVQTVNKLSMNQPLQPATFAPKVNRSQVASLMQTNVASNIGGAK